MHSTLKSVHGCRGPSADIESEMHGPGSRPGLNFRAFHAEQCLTCSPAPPVKRLVMAAYPCGPEQLNAHHHCLVRRGVQHVALEHFSIHVAAPRSLSHLSREAIREAIIEVVRVATSGRSSERSPVVTNR